MGPHLFKFVDAPECILQSQISMSIYWHADDALQPELKGEGFKG